MKRAIILLFVSLLLLGSCSTRVARREKSLVLQSRALAALDTKEYDKAVPLLKKAVELAPQESEGRYNLVLALLANKEFDEAIGVSDASFALFPAHLEFPLAKAYALRQQGAQDKAFALYEEVLKKDRGNYPLHATLMELALKEGSLEFAKERALYLLSVHKQEARAFSVLASLEGEQSWYAMASSLMKEASKEDPKPPQEQSIEEDALF